MSPSKLINSLSPAWQAVTTLGGAIAFGFVVALALSGWVDLPAEVEEQGNAIVELQTNMSRIQRSDSAQTAALNWLRCIHAAELSNRDPIERCGL